MANARYWALIGPYYAFTADLHPNEEASHRRDYERRGYRIIGAFDDVDTAQAAIELELRRARVPSAAERLDA
jgi:hypothetical protein